METQFNFDSFIIFHLRKNNKNNSVLYFWDDDVASKCAKRPCQVEEIHTPEITTIITMETEVSLVSCFPKPKQMKT